MTQVIGLTEEAHALVEGQEVLAYTEEGVKVLPDGSHEPFTRPVYKSDVSREEYGQFEGMFGEPYPLHRYTLPDGRILEEVIQAAPWSSGPCIFLALQENGQWLPETLWSDEEIENA